LKIILSKLSLEDNWDRVLHKEKNDDSNSNYKNPNHLKENINQHKDKTKTNILYKTTKSTYPVADLSDQVAYH